MSDLKGKPYFDYYVNERHWNPTVKGEWQRNYARMIEDVFGLAKRGLRVLDVGGASGSQASAMRDLGADVWVVERDEYFVQISPFENLRGRILNSEAQWIPFRTGMFDFVHCSQVLEHLPDEVEAIVALTEIARVARPGALFFASLQVDNGEPPPEDDDVTHSYIVPMGQWHEWLRVSGWEIMDHECVELQNAFDAQPMQQQYGWDYFIAKRRGA